jgi:hypothetical protein
MPASASHIPEEEMEALIDEAIRMSVNGGRDAHRP